MKVCLKKETIWLSPQYQLLPFIKIRDLKIVLSPFLWVAEAGFQALGWPASYKTEGSKPREIVGGSASYRLGRIIWEHY